MKLSNIKPHLLLFSFGFIYYLISPVVVGSHNLFLDIQGFNSWHYDYDSLSYDKLKQYCLIVSFWFLSFVIPSQIIRSNNDFSIKNNSLPRVSKLIVIAIIFPILLYTVLKIPTMINHYGSEEVTGKGTIASGSMFILYINIYLLSNNDRRGLLTKLIKWALYIVTFCLLVTGTRMYFLIVVIALMINYFFYEKNGRIPFKFYLFSIITLIFILIVGVLRNGLQNTVTMEALLSVFFMEPLFTWWSAMSYLGLNDIPAISFPSGFFSSFLNFIPTFIFPDKASILISTKTLADFYTPLGAESLFVSVSANFGYIFGCFYFMFLGGYFSIIHSLSKTNIYIRTHYICICAILPFQFYRDGFDIVNKQFLFNLFIIPIVIILISRLYRVNEK